MKIKAPDALLAAEVTRRGLMKTTAIGGLACQQRLHATFYPTGVRRLMLSPPPGKSGVECLYR
jgi:hypothetical protein